MHSSVQYGVKYKKVQRKKYNLNCGEKKTILVIVSPSILSQVEDKNEITRQTCHTPRDKHVKPPQQLSAVTTETKKRGGKIKCRSRERVEMTVGVRDWRLWF